MNDFNKVISELFQSSIKVDGVDIDQCQPDEEHLGCHMCIPVQEEIIEGQIHTRYFCGAVFPKVTEYKEYNSSLENINGYMNTTQAVRQIKPRHYNDENDFYPRWCPLVISMVNDLKEDYRKEQEENNEKSATRGQKEDKSDS
jgi:hypothetical protein